MIAWAETGASLPPMSELESDAALARAVTSGGARGSRAEALFCARFGPRVRAYGLRHLRDPVAAEDLVQDVLHLVLVKLRTGEVREPDRIGSFVLGTARLSVGDVRRRARRREDLARGLAAEPEVVVPPPVVLDLEQLAVCLGALTERARSVVLLTFHDDRTAPEIGRAIGLSPGNVRVIRHRAVAALQRCMGAGGGGA